MTAMSADFVRAAPEPPLLDMVRRVDGRPGPVQTLSPRSRHG